MQARRLPSVLAALSVAVVALVALASSARAQSIPPAVQGLPLLPEYPYVPGSSIGPLGPIDSPEADADYIRFGEAWWTVVDNGGTDPTPLATFQWLAPDLVALSQVPGASTQVDPWGGGMELFRRIHAHRLQPAGPATIQELLATDSQVAAAFKHWTHYHQLVTMPSSDAVAHQTHMALVANALGAQTLATVRGVPYMDAGILVSDRLELVNPGAPLMAGGAPGTAHQPMGTALDRCIRMLAGVLSGFPGLYKADVDYTAFGLSGGTPGFDCDDFADALGARIRKDKPGVTACNVYCKWTSKNPTNNKKAKAAHLVTKIKSGGTYWLLDAQTGAVSGPHCATKPMDATPILGGYNPCPNTVVTEQEDHANGDRSAWQWLWNGEPDPWHTSQAIRDCFQMVTGLDPACFQ